MEKVLLGIVSLETCDNICIKYGIHRQAFNSLDKLQIEINILSSLALIKNSTNQIL